MTRLEDALRASLAADPAHPADAATMTDRVRTGVRRRRAARTRVAAVAVVVVVAAATAFVGLRSHDAPPSPAPRPTGDLRGLETSPWPDRTFFIAAAGGSAYAATVQHECDCTAVLRTTGGRWSTVATVDGAISAMVFASDGLHGWVVAGQRLLTTANAGASWTEVRLPGLVPAPDAEPIDLVLVEDVAWVADSVTARIWRVTGDAARGEPFDVPGSHGVEDLVAAGDRLYLSPWLEPGESDEPVRLTAAGSGTWQDLSAPCLSTELQLVAVGDLAYAACSGDDTLYRVSPDGAALTPAGTLPAKEMYPHSTSPGGLALLSDHDSGLWVLRPDGTTEQATGLPAPIMLFNAATIGPTTYLATSEGVYRSADGRAWTQVSGWRGDD